MNNEEKAEYRSLQQGNARVWLEEVYKNYALMAAVIMISTMTVGEKIKLRDVRLANEMVRTLSMISSLIEKERHHSNDPRGDSAKRS